MNRFIDTMFPNEGKKLTEAQSLRKFLGLIPVLSLNNELDLDNVIEHIHYVASKLEDDM